LTCLFKGSTHAAAESHARPEAGHINVVEFWSTKEVNRRTVDSLGQRWIELDGACNFRDLGGYGMSDGARVRWGTVFRSDALHQLSPDDLRRLEELGVERVIDLRSPEEVAALGRGSLADAKIEYISAPIIPTRGGEARAAPPGDDIAERYLWYLEVGRASFVEVFEIIATSDRGGGRLPLRGGQGPHRGSRGPSPGGFGCCRR
jgi:hypothetical protein